MKSLLVTFGDSWTYGSELEDPETQSWTALLGKEYTDVYNLGVPASSIGHIPVMLDSLLLNVNLRQYEKKVFVFGLTSPSRYLMWDNVRNKYVNVTSEAVYYTDVISKNRPPEVVEHLNPFSWEFYKRIDSDTYQIQQVSQTVAFLQGWCLKNGVQDVYLSYFENQNFNQFVDLSKMIDGGLAIGLKYSAFSQHPDEHGHAEIAERIGNFICKRYPE
jgi:hypothetical protein